MRGSCPPGVAERASHALLLATLALAFLGGTACAAKHKRQQPALPPERVFEIAQQKIARKHYYTGRTMLQELMPRVPPTTAISCRRFSWRSPTPTSRTAGSSTTVRR